MSTRSPNKLVRSITERFDMRADFMHAVPYGSGHINDTYRAEFDQAGARVRFTVQRVNPTVFKEPDKVMENIGRVTSHALSSLIASGSHEPRRRTLTCVPTVDGGTFHKDEDGGLWRVYQFIERVHIYEVLETNEQAYQVARAFGEFQNLAATLPGEPLHETIPDFHHTPKRLAALEAAVEADPHNRAASVSAEIDFARSRADDCSRVTDLIETGHIPIRVTHNDTKLSNVLLDEVTSEAVCVIDLDTTMPGSSLYDFGDMVRSATSASAEDDPDIGNAGILLDRFEALVRGYLSAATFLNPAERRLLAFSGKLITLELGIRFLTDHLLGDQYFRIQRPGQNLDRCRNQFGFVSVVEQNLPQMKEIVSRYC
ncbi:MAG: phosphotransferase enzyme family protein [Verrucomicrobiales bacterium]|nr:phosphotransferase [Verrucomicrobiota bacterium JB025]